MKNWCVLLTIPYCETTREFNKAAKSNKARLVEIKLGFKMYVLK